tara:strand:- start:234 stop:428 length:195 start_codon:yes stop_codon:yes gene_type:complete
VLSDEFELINVIVFPDRYQHFCRTIRNERFLLVSGTVQRQHGVVNVIAETVNAMKNKPYFAVDY